MAKKETQDNSAFQALKSAIRNNTPEGLYIFHGEEVFLLHHYLEQLRRKIVEELTESFNFHRFNNENFDIQAFADAVENFPMMAERTMVQVDEIDIFKLPEGERGKVAELLDDIPEWCTVVFTFETVAWKPDKRQKKLWEVIENNASIVEFAKQNQRDLVAWIQRHFAAKKKTISGELCCYLIDITGGTMTALSGEIEKIAAYSGAQAICRADIDAVTEPVMDAVVFDMTDLLGQGQYAAALYKLQTLLKMQQDPISILGAVGSHFRRLSTARTLTDNGRPASELAKIYGISDYAARRTMEAVRRFPVEFCAAAAGLILETDYKMKTSFDDQDRLLELLILQLAQEAGRG